MRRRMDHAVSRETALAAVARAHPRWEVWRGVTGTCYGRLLRSSPPVVVSGQTPAELAEAIGRAEGSAP
jgi:hypothetical protein